MGHWHPTLGYLCKQLKFKTWDTHSSIDCHSCLLSQDLPRVPRHTRCKLLPSPPMGPRLLPPPLRRLSLWTSILHITTNSVLFPESTSSSSLPWVFFSHLNSAKWFNDQLNDKLIQSLVPDSTNAGSRENPDAQICLWSFLRRHPFVPLRHLAYDL